LLEVVSLLQERQELGGRGQEVEVSIKTVFSGSKAQFKKGIIHKTRSAKYKVSLLQSHSFKGGFLLPPAFVLLPPEIGVII
jgi:hypothetical protein